MADKKISELSTASEIKNSDNIELSQDTGNGLVSLKATILALATKILTNINFTSVLTTTDKTITGAINEIAEGGGGGGSSTFSGLTDVEFTNLSNGQIAKYNSTSRKWENANESGGGGLPDYSTTEHKTGRKWVDGKDIWEKTTITHTILPYDESWVDSGIEITGDVVSVYGSITRDNEPIPLGANFNSTIFSKWIVRNNKLLIGVKGDYGETYKINNITAEYTKSS